MYFVAEWGGKLFTILEIVCGIGFLILIHEFGHFILAKLHKVKVEVFSIGMGPVVCSYRPGLGFRKGSGVKEYEDKLKAEHEAGPGKHSMGQTEYRLSWLVPLGGYVRMAGEPFDSQTGDPGELGSKSPGVRLQIFAAGATMNLLFAFPICVAMYLAGMVEVLPVIGSIEPGSCEWRSELQKGDVLLSVNGKAIRSIQEYREIAILSDPGTKLQVEVLRPPAGRSAGWEDWLAVAPEGKRRTLFEAAGEGPLVVPSAASRLDAQFSGGQRVKVEVVTAGSEGYGLGAWMFPVVGLVMSGSEADRARLRAGDRIVSFGGERLRGFLDLQDHILRSNGEVVFEVRGSDGWDSTLRVHPRPEVRWIIETEDSVSVVVDSVKGGSSAAKAGLRDGDEITSVDAKETKTWADFQKVVHELAGKPAAVAVLRNGEQEALQAEIGTDPEFGTGTIGIAERYGDTFVRVPDGSALAEAKVEVGDILKKVAGKDAKALSDLYNAAVKGKGEEIEIEVARGGKPVALKVKPRKTEIPTLGVQPGAITVKKKYGFSEALSTGLGDGFKFMRMTILMFKKLILGHESTKGLAGPIGIFTSSYAIAQEGFGKFLWFLALITVSLGVFNLLPIPFLDGGHIALLILEKLRGKPLSENALYRTQIVGLVLIGSLLIFVTYNDISRIVTGFR